VAEATQQCKTDPPEKPEFLTAASVDITTQELKTYSNNPFVGEATVLDQVGSPSGFLVTGMAGTIPPMSVTNPSGTTWRFTFGTALNPVPAGQYLFTVTAMGSTPPPASDTIALKLQ